MRLTLLAVAICSASIAAAQTVPSGADAADALARLKAADSNADGKWDKAEWLAAGRREMGFVYIDADKDGFVTQDELEAGMAKLRAMRNK